MSSKPPLQDEPAHIDITRRNVIYDGFRRFEAYDLNLHAPDRPPLAQVREILRIGQAVGILVIDPVRDAVVLLRQFRLTAQLATGLGEMIEIPAGLVEQDEEPAVTARRECIEEIGLDPGEVHHLFSCMVSPGACDELAHFYLAFVDATALPAECGAPGEAEVTHPFLCPVPEALAAMDDGSVLFNGYLRLALMWLAAHRAETAARAEHWLASA